MDKRRIDELKKEFSWVNEDSGILAVLLFGSMVEEKDHVKSDIDIAIVVPGSSPYYYDCDGVNYENVLSSDILMKVFRKIDIISENLDVHIFEDLPLHIKMDIIENHELIYTSDKIGMYEYFYNYRKLWDDQKHRNTMNRNELIAGL